MLVHVPLSLIDDNPFQRRQEYGDIKELARDIYQHKLTRPDTLGLQQVPTGRLVGDDGYLAPTAGMDEADWLDEDGRLQKYFRIQLEFGHRRKRAFEYLAQNYPEFYRMPVYIRDLDDEAMLNGVWSENRSRRDLSAVEEAELLQLKLERAGNQREVAEEWGLARSTVANRLRLLSLPHSLKKANREGLLSERQCLSLATAVKLDELLEGDDIGWGNNTGSTWGVPVDPQRYIQYVIDNPTTTSQEIRAVTNKMVDHAGAELPKAVAAYDAETADDYDAGEIIQPQCKGCPLRINNHCLDASCLEVKMAWFVDQLVDLVADELGIPASTEDAHFDYGYAFTDALETYWQSGDRENLVFAWRGGYGVRPFADNYYQHTTRDKLQNNGRAGIIIGHTTGSLPDAPGQEPDDIPDRATIDAWRKRAQQIAQQARKTAKAAMAEALQETVNDYRPIMALAQQPNIELSDDPAGMNKALLEFLWKRGLWMPYSQATAVDEIQTIGDMLERAGIGRRLLRDTDTAADLSQRAVIWLNYYYYYRTTYYAEERIEAAKTAINALRTEFDRSGLIAGDLLDLSLELDRAARDIEKHAQQTKTA